MFKISSKLKDSFKYTNSSKIAGVFIRKAHLFAFLLPFSPMWQRDGNRCSQINECKMTSNHPHFSCVDVLASTLTQKIRNSNLSRKITDMSYETDYLTCKSRGWFRTVTVLVLPSFLRPHHAYQSVCVFVRACVSVLAEACEWQAVSERDVIIWLMSVRVVSRGRVTSLAAGWHSVDRKHYFMISPREESTLVTLSAALTPIAFCGFSATIHKKEEQDIHHNNMKETSWTVYLVLFFYRSYFFLSSFISFCSEGLEEGSVPPLPVLTLWLLLCNNNAQVLVQCPAVDLRVRW